MVRGLLCTDSFIFVVSETSVLISRVVSLPFSRCSVLPPSLHPHRSASPSPTIKVVGFDAPGCSAVLSTTSAEALRKKQSAEFWAVIEGRSPRAPVLRKATSFAGHPTTAEAGTGLGITLVLSLDSASMRALIVPVASASRLCAPAPTLRKCVSCPGCLPSAPKPSPAAATLSLLALSSLWKGSAAHRSHGTSSSTITTTSTVTALASRPTTASSSFRASTAASSLQRVASSSSIAPSTRHPEAKLPVSALARTTSSSVSSCPSGSMLAVLVTRRPSSSCQRSASTGPAGSTSRPLRRMISFDSVVSSWSADEFQFDRDSALDTDEFASDFEALLDLDSAIEDDNAEVSGWDNALTCSGSVASI